MGLGPITPACGLSLPFFPRRAASCELRAASCELRQQSFSFFLFGCGFDRRQQFHLGLFCCAMVAMLQRLDARRFFFRSELRVCSFLPLFLKVFWNRLSGHDTQCGRTMSSKSVLFWPGFYDSSFARHLPLAGP